jgi:hypothetical protein
MFETELLPEFHTDLVPALSNLKSDYLSRHFLIIGRRRRRSRTRVSSRGNTLFEKRRTKTLINNSNNGNG